MGKSSINGPFSMAMLNNQRVIAQKEFFDHIGNTGSYALRHSAEVATPTQNRYDMWVKQKHTPSKSP